MKKTYCGKADCLSEPWCSAWNLTDFIPSTTRPFSAVKTDDEGHHKSSPTDTSTA